MHLHKYFEEPGITNAEKIWQGISELINRQKKKQKAIFALKCPRSNKLLNDPTEFPKQKAIFALKCPRSNKLLNDPTEFPNIFNNFFSSVLEISQNKALKRKYMIAYFKSFHKQMIILIYLPY